MIVLFEKFCRTMFCYFLVNRGVLFFFSLRLILHLDAGGCTMHLRFCVSVLCGEESLIVLYFSFIDLLTFLKLHSVNMVVW